MYQTALEAIKDYKLKQVNKYNKKHKRVVYNVGDLVWLKDMGKKSNKAEKISAKLFPPWKGIVKIKTKHSDTQYTV